MIISFCLFHLFNLKDPREVRMNTWTKNDTRWTATNDNSLLSFLKIMLLTANDSSPDLVT